MKHALGRFTNAALRGANTLLPETLTHGVHQSVKEYSMVMTNKKLAPVTEHAWIEYTPDQENKEHLAVEDLHNCVCVLFHAKNPTENLIQAGLVHFNTLDNSGQTLEDAIIQANELRNSGYSVDTRVIINATCASDMTATITKDMQNIAKEHVHNALNAHDFKEKTVMVNDDNFVIPSKETPPEIAKDFVIKSFLKDIAARELPSIQQEQIIVDNSNHLSSQRGGGFGRE